MNENKQKILSAMKIVGVLFVYALNAACGAGSSASYGNALGDSGSFSGGQEFGATQGGVQDAGLVRTLVAAGQIPPPGAFSVEGFFSEHDLPLEGDPCPEVLCLRSALAAAPTLAGRESVWVQVGMSSTISPETFERPSLAIVATIDVSGSMGWGYNTNGNGYVMPGLLAELLASDIARQLGADDQFAIVTFGASVKTELNPVTGGAQNEISETIDTMAVGGSTNMEAGLKRAYELARELRAAGETDDVRVMLFTDAQPNVGGTSSSVFETLAAGGADDDIGLTVFGLGIGLGAEVYSQMSELRGGNAFSLTTTQDVVSLMRDSWPWMAVPIAHQLRADFDIPEGYTVAETFGFPSGTNESLLPSLVVESVFPSKRKGALLARLIQTSDDFVGFSLAGQLGYESFAHTMVQQNLTGSFEANSLASRPYYEQTGIRKSVALAVLVTGLHDASTLYAFDPGGAITTAGQAVTRFRKDLESIDDPSFETELELAEDLLLLMENGADQGSLYGQTN